MAEATLLQHKMLLNLLELAKGNRNYLQMEKKATNFLPLSLQIIFLSQVTYFQLHHTKHIKILSYS